jgi:23S rRNA pseudouridine2605 synthase
MRLNRFLAAAGLGSRRSCEELILAGQITINGAMCTTLATQVEPSDVVKAGNRVLHTAAPATLLLHKPAGFVCTASDEEGRRTVFDLLPPNFPRLFHVGRLDKESEGLLILTNDGDLSLKLTHPRYKVEKEYEVTLDRPFDFALADRLLHGMRLVEGWASAESVHRISTNKLKVVLRQGMKRQIRLMFYELGYEVDRLVRTRIGPIRIDALPLAHWRVLTQREIEALIAAGIAPEKAASPQRPFHPKVQRAERPDRPARAPRAPHPRSERPKQPNRAGGKPEEIPFTPRAARSGPAAPGDRSRVHRAPRSFESDDQKPSSPALPERTPGKPSKRFISNFFAGKIGRPAGGKAQGGKQATGKFSKGRAPHPSSSRQVRGSGSRA